jgi:hypothetical protein
MIAVGDPVGIGLINSLARPSGNITGLSQNIVESTGKRVELLKLVTPGISEVAVLWNPDESNSVLNMKELQSTSRGLGLQLVSFEARGEAALKRLLEAPIERSHRALYVVPGPLFVTNLQAIATFARTNGLPSVFHLPEFTQFTSGRALQVPATMRTERLGLPGRRLGNLKNVAVYFFTLPGPRKATLNGRLAVIPKHLVDANELPLATSFLEGLTPTIFKNGFRITAWTEGEFVYVCYLEGPGDELQRLQPKPQVT